MKTSNETEIAPLFWPVWLIFCLPKPSDGGCYPRPGEQNPGQGNRQEHEKQ